MLDRVDYNPQLQAVHLVLTRACNLSCCYCQKHQGGGELSTAEWKCLIDRLSETHDSLSIIVKGGEPMLREDLMEILSHIKSKGHTVFLITNGTLIRNQQTARCLENYVDHVEISLDGISPESTDSVKGEGAFERMMTDIGYLRHTRIKLGLSFVILEKNSTILWEPLEDFMKEHVGGDTPIRIDNRMSFPVNFDRGSEDFFDFLRTGDELTCHGRLGKTTPGGEVEIDADGCMHPCTPMQPDQRSQVKTL